MRALVFVLVIGCAQAVVREDDASPIDGGADVLVAHDAGVDVLVAHDAGVDAPMSDAGHDGGCAVHCSTDDDCACHASVSPRRVGCCDIATATCFGSPAQVCPAPPSDAGPPPACPLACTDDSFCMFGCVGAYVCVDGGCQPG